MTFPPLKYLFLSVFTGTMLIGACKKEEKKEPDAAFDRAGLLTRIFDAHLMPSLDSFNRETAALHDKSQALVANPNDLLLNESRQQWILCFERFQSIRMFSFGPGETGLLGAMDENLGTWPVDIGKVENRIVQKDLGMQDFRRDTRGFPALEYLLFGDSALLKLQASANRGDYLMALVSDIQKWSIDQRNAWFGYRSDFIGSTGKSAGSSTSEFYNSWLKSYEQVKNQKVALPAGQRAGQTQPEPHLVEARFSKTSIRMLKAHLMAIESLWYGRDLLQNEGVGFDDYLDKVHGGEELKRQTIERFEQLNLALNTFQNHEILSDVIISDPARVNKLLEELQKLTRFVKSDLSSLLGIAITYSSGDGD